MINNLHRRKYYIFGIVLIIGIAGLGLIAAQAYSTENAPSGYLPGDIPSGLFGSSIESDHYQLHWNINACGGGPISSAHYQLNSTIGQSAIGIKSSDHYTECTGFWCGLKDLINYLPLIFKN